MHTIGVIAEYNPFHSGHGHHLRMLSQTFGRNWPCVKGPT